MKKEAVLKSIATRLRIRSIQLTTKAGSGHPTTCLSMAELMACLFFDEMKYDIRNPNNLGNDEFVLSKGHAAPILWASYAEADLISEKELQTFRQFGSRLEGHPTPRMQWIKAATGSLGQGLAVGLGMALAAKLQKAPSKVFVMLGDGECAEGSVWEAAALAGKYKPDNLVAILDANRLGQSGESLYGHDIKNWQKRFDAIGWKTLTIDGHSIPQILNAFVSAKKAKGPVIIIAKTVKGKGVSFLENKNGWHGKALTKEQKEKAFKELGSMLGVDSKKYVEKPKKFIKHISSDFRLQTVNYKQDELVATRTAFGNALKTLGKNQSLISLDGDVQNSTYSEYFSKTYPKQFVECFIAEQTMVGVAQGFAIRGFVPVASTFACFLTRAHDQLRMAAISKANIKLCGSHCGVSIGEDGPSQMGLEDLALFRSLPESIILYPCDAVSAEKCTELMVKHKGLSYLRTTRPKTPIIYKNTENFKIGGCKILKQSKSDKFIIVAAGITVHEALKATKNTNNVCVVDAYSVKPLDEKTIKQITKNKKVIVVEDHYPEGGLGEAVRSLGINLAEHLCIKQIPQSGKSADLMQAYGIDAQAIKSVVKKLL
ncbi:transketolase [Candidatus Woesearchaeota archaeon CG10_big_fil_rev_8_21_14_0_10_37_12]|nr:MAG: transketolase [Candidatus Woesearchaeota archaeon CG10_big_fil_rev_8_21_14_0_10_37_12]